jgi:hypothetical protein
MTGASATRATTVHESCTGDRRREGAEQSGVCSYFAVRFLSLFFHLRAACSPVGRTQQWGVLGRAFRCAVIAAA